MVIKDVFLKNSNGVLYCSAKGISGYAEAGRRIVYKLIEEGTPLSWYQFKVDFTTDDETDSTYQSIKDYLNKDIEFDTVIFHCTPDCWYNHIDKFKIKFIGKKLIGYPTWETDKIPDIWVKYLNMMDEVWVSCNINKETFEKCGVKVPISVIPYPVIKKPLPEINYITLTEFLNKSKCYSKNDVFNYSSDWRIFYNIGEWSDRKNLEDTIISFCKAFNKNDKVKLILKTFHLDYSDSNVNYCIEKLEEILKLFPSHPEIILIVKELTQTELLFLHSIGDCFYSMTRGEGFCLGAYDAYNYGKQIIMTGYGGHVDYLGKNYPGLINYNLVSVNFSERDKIYTPDQKWANPKINDGVDKLKNYVKSIPIYNDKVILNGWYFKECREGKFFINSSSESTLRFLDSTFDFVELDIKHNYDRHEKKVEILLDSLVKKTILLTNFDIVKVRLPSKNVKTIDFATYVIIPRNYDKNILDNRRIGITLTGIRLIKGENVIEIPIRDIRIENELDDFSSLSNEDFIEEESEIKLNEGKINLAKIVVESDSEFGGIVYIGQYGTCGYATAAKGNLCHFFMKGIPVSWQPLYFDNSQLSDDCFYNSMIKSLIKKRIEFYDTVIIHATPDIWPNLIEEYKKFTKGKRLIGYTVWETSKLPYTWVENINECVSEVWCPSNYNADVFKNSGVTIPIRVFPHVFLKKELPSRDKVFIKGVTKRIKEDGKYTFYNISELNPRKGVEDLVKVFCEVFTNNDRVRLILKVHYKNYDDINKKFCLDKLNEIVLKYENPPEIDYILNNLTEKEMLGLHSIGDCYVSLCKAEGFGLTIFEAYKYGKRVITTGYSGQIDYLGKDYQGLVKYTIGDVQDMTSFSKFYSEDQQWAYPDLNHAKELLKKCI